jgi:adenosine deaminase CECR1
MVGAPTMSLYSWKQLAKWSIDYSCLNDDQQKKGHKILTTAWTEFCAYVVNTYGDLMVGDEIDGDKFKAKCSKGECANPK